jgi:ubiquitin carboxyl-terminal hydrolase 1
MASLSYLQPHIESIHARAEALDVPTPVIDALKELFRSTFILSVNSTSAYNLILDLNTPRSSSTLSDPIISSTLYRRLHPRPNLGGPRPRTSSTLFNSREHQDAQELFQLVSECIKNEMAAVEKEGFRDRGIAGVLDLERPKSTDGQDNGKEAKKAGIRASSTV